MTDTHRLLEYEAGRKSALLAYVLWFFVGTFGVHRMYLGRWFSGFVMLLLSSVGWLLHFILIGYIPLAIVGLWWLLDAVLTYVMAESYNRNLARRIY